MRSSLSRFQPVANADERQLYDMRKALWHKQGKILIDPAEVADPWTRQAFVNEANRIYGRYSSKSG